MLVSVNSPRKLHNVWGANARRNKAEQTERRRECESMDGRRYIHMMQKKKDGTLVIHIPNQEEKEERRVETQSALVAQQCLQAKKRKRRAQNR